MKMVRELQQQHGWLCATACAIVLFAVTLNASAAQARFATPEEAVAAMVDAVGLNNEPLITVILGAGADALIHSGDPVQDQRRRTAFVEAYGDAHRLVAQDGDKVVLHIGKDDWPMPIPLVKSHGRWRFDTEAGEQEILARRIGRNELAAIEVCRAIVDAEREYAMRDIDGDGILEYAARIASTPGKHDGLYWKAAPGAPPSPLGPFLAAAAEGHADAASLAPYHGYFYRVLSKQGKNAPGGARDYIARGKMIGGFAVIVYPARYRASGVMTFIVNQDGVVYEKNLGNNSTASARKITSYDPDSTWKRL